MYYTRAISPRSVDRADRDIAREASAANETNGIDRASEGWIALHVCYALIPPASSRVPIEEQQPERGDEQNQRDVALRASLSRDGFLHLHVAHV